MIPLNELFEVQYGHSLELNRLKLLSPQQGGIPFVSRKMGDNGISAYVEPIADIEPASAGELTCALSGNGVLSTFLQEMPFYTGYHIARLKPLVTMPRSQLLFYCACIFENRYRFSYGRQANRTLKSILVPELHEVPEYVKQENIERYDGCSYPQVSIQPVALDSVEWKSFRYDEIFIINKGYYNKKPPKSLNHTDVPFIGATENQNGITSFISEQDVRNYSRDGSFNSDESVDKKLFSGRCITVTNNGSVGEAFYQPVTFTCSHDVNPLYLKDNSITLSPELGLFIATVIRTDKYRWGYGRKWRPIRMPNSLISLPVTEAGEPDWIFMENYIKSLPFSSSLN